MGEMVQALCSLHVANERRRQRDGSNVEEKGRRRPRDKRRESKQVKQASLSTMPRNNLDYTGTSFERETTLQAAQHIYESKDGHCHFASVISYNACSNWPEDMDDKSFLHPDSHVKESTLTIFTSVYSSSSTKKFHIDMVGKGSNFPIEAKTGDGIDKIQEIHLEASTNENLHTCALLILVGGRSTSVIGGVNNSAIDMKFLGAGGAVNSQWHTSPVEQCNASARSDTNLCNSENSISSPFMRQSYISKGQFVFEESTTRTRARPMPLPSSVEKVPLLRSDAPVVFESKRIRRHAHSSPLIGKSYSRKSVVCNSGPLPSLQVEPLSKLGPISHCPKSCIYVSPKTSLSLSPHHLSPPRISELHELPRPPDKRQEHIIELELGTKPIIIPSYRYILGVVETFLDVVLNARIFKESATKLNATSILGGVKIINKVAPVFFVSCSVVTILYLHWMTLHAMCEATNCPKCHSKQGLVTACEASLLVGNVGQKVLRANRMEDRIRVIHKRSDELQIGIDMPSCADVLVSGILDSELLGEGFIPMLQHAHNHLLMPNA
eukprot:Gb_37066 [translate_table: standard]